MLKLTLFFIFTLLVSCSNLNYHKEEIVLHGDTYDYRVFGSPNLNEVRAAVEVLKKTLGLNEYIYTVRMKEGAVIVKTVNGIPNYRDGNQGNSYRIQKIDGAWVPIKEDAIWIS